VLINACRRVAGRDGSDVLLDPNEYLHDLHRISDPWTFLSSLSTSLHLVPVSMVILSGPRMSPRHPPLTDADLLAARPRPAWAGGCWAGGRYASLWPRAASVALAVTVRELRAEAAARRILPFIALFPWCGLDGCVGGRSVRRRCSQRTRARLPRCGTPPNRPEFIGAACCWGIAVFLSYGLVLFGLVVLLAILLTVSRRGLRKSSGAVVDPRHSGSLRSRLSTWPWLQLGEWIARSACSLLPGHRTANGRSPTSSLRISPRG
jgi:hypothetical protein